MEGGYLGPAFDTLSPRSAAFSDPATSFMNNGWAALMSDNALASASLLFARLLAARLFFARWLIFCSALFPLDAIGRLAKKAGEFEVEDWA
jgi:hypothetical protein